MQLSMVSAASVLHIMDSNIPTPNSDLRLKFKTLVSAKDKVGMLIPGSRVAIPGSRSRLLISPK